MHNYATNSEERRFVPFFLAMAAVGLGIATTWFLGLWHFDLPWWAPPLDTMTYYGLLYWWFDEVLWKWQPLRSVGLVRVPILAGKWMGRVVPASAAGVQQAADIDVVVMIRQTWQQIRIDVSTTHSKSKSLSASLTLDGEAVLSYEYANEPLPSAPSTMHAHRGGARLMLSADNRLVGDYYSGRDRQSFGTIDLGRA